MDTMDSLDVRLLQMSVFSRCSSSPDVRLFPRSMKSIVSIQMENGNGKISKMEKKIKRRKDEKKTLEIIGEVKMDQNGKSMGVERNCFGNGLEMVWIWKWNGENGENGKTTKWRQNQLHYSHFFDFFILSGRNSHLDRHGNLGGKWNGSTIVHRKLRES
jgi:hypothetical protein